MSWAPSLQLPCCVFSANGGQDATLEVAGAAKAHLDKARQLASSLPAEARPLMLGAVPCRLYLDALEVRFYHCPE